MGILTTKNASISNTEIQDKQICECKDNYKSWNDIYNDTYLHLSLQEYIHFIKNTILEKDEEEGYFFTLQYQYYQVLQYFVSNDGTPGEPGELPTLHSSITLPSNLSYGSISTTIFVEAIQYFVYFLLCKDIAFINGYEVDSGNSNNTNLFKYIDTSYSDDNERDKYINTLLSTPNINLPCAYLKLRDLLINKYNCDLNNSNNYNKQITVVR